MRPTRPASVLISAVIVAVMFGGCECRGLERDPNAAAKDRRFDELLRKNAPPIPASRAVGCDVCPFHCQHENLGEKLSMEELMARYRRIAMKKGNRADIWDELIRLACVAALNGPDAELEFLQLLTDPREPVRYYAASHALDLAFAIKEPVRVLEEITSSKERYAAHAAARLVLWKQERDGLRPPDPHRLERQQRPHVQ